jgi:hypothetical protein
MGEVNSGTSTASREDPTGFFDVVLGLVYEDLPQASANSASSIATRELFSNLPYSRSLATVATEWHHRRFRFISLLMYRLF